jgi:four helix bundle protein
VVGKKVETYEDLDDYQRLLELHLEVHALTLAFPSLEKYELGSQLRRSSNAIAANLAEGWNNKHLNIYLEGINRSLGELRETRHHLTVAFRKSYLSEANFDAFRTGYDECGRMLRGLERALELRQSSGRRATSHVLRPTSYVIEIESIPP